MNELFAFEQEILHCIANNPRNNNFKFGIRARNDAECLEILNGVRENKAFFERELAKIIGNCTVLLDFNKMMVTIKKK